MVKGFDGSFVETHSHVVLTGLKFVVNLPIFALKC